MSAVVASVLIFDIVGATLSLFLYLPAVAVVESISPRRASARAAVWFSALLLPIIGGIAGSVFAIHSAMFDRFGSPHLTSERPHLCSQWLLDLPDAAGYVTFLGFVGASLVAGCVIRFFFSAARSCLTARTFRAVASPTDGVVLVDSAGPFLATLGLLRPVVVATTGLRDMLTQAEYSAALRHEDAHARRRDNLRDIAATACVTCVLFVPTAHLFLRYWREEAERACDDEAATPPEEVASALLRVARVAQDQSRQRLLPTGEVCRRHSLADVERRVKRLLQREAPEGTTARAEVPVVGMVMALVMGGIVALAIMATARQLRDTLRCVADVLLELLSG